MGPVQARWPDGRLHLQHGPIDLVIEAFGAADEAAAAYRQAAAAFAPVLNELVAELAVLRSPLGDTLPVLRGPVARRMAAACWPYRARFVTPMAAVAGAVADHVLAAMVTGRSLDRAYVNDGGDIALHLSPGQRFTVGVVADLAAPAIDGTVSVTAAMPVRGIATSGRATKGQGGRSVSLGIADAVTVLAHDAAAADAAATMIANAVDLPGHPAIRRMPAVDLDPDSDLGTIPVTIGLGSLEPQEVDAALAAGRAVAEDVLRTGLAAGAMLVLKRRVVTVGEGVPALAAA